ncbi:MAG: hypothetical protein EOO42_04325 [Flavobacteriales bacterium]|nr:MAG: hypothetical protein EOO42_04325 [Flavobacteriales bacterium]
MKVLNFIILGIVIIAFAALFNWLIWSFYTHFQVKFNWYPFTYWEFWGATILLSWFGRIIFKRGK